MKPKTVKIFKENDEFQQLNFLKTSREKRNRNGFIFEGVRNINNAIKYGWNITAFAFSTEKGLSDWAKEVLSASKASLRYDLSFELLAKLSNKEEPSELIAIAEMPKDDFKRLPVREDLLAVVFDSPSSPGNLGTLVRACDALGAHCLIITGHAADVYDPEAISATTGSLFALPIIRLQSQKELMPWIETMKKRYPETRVVGTDESGTHDIYAQDFCKPTILLAGNEKRGLSAGYREAADDMVKIPMQGSASSLNVAVATSIIIAEAKRQRSVSWN